MKETLFLKLGGSLITEKAKPHTPRYDVINRLAEEISAAWHKLEHQQLILGHGSGSFGHVPAKTYGTRQGVRTVEEWNGFISVWREASALNRIVIEALIEAGIPAMSFSPSSSVTTNQGNIISWNLQPIENALNHHVLPVVYGDVVFDEFLGGTILSTEDLFGHLAGHFIPVRILLAGLEPGIWADYPNKTDLLSEIKLSHLEKMGIKLGGSEDTDVTGGMASKLDRATDWVRIVPGIEISIFSGCKSGDIEAALAGKKIGTLLHA